MLYLCLHLYYTLCYVCIRTASVVPSSAGSTSPLSSNASAKASTPRSPDFIPTVGQVYQLTNLVTDDFNGQLCVCLELLLSEGKARVRLPDIGEDKLVRFEKLRESVLPANSINLPSVFTATASVSQSLASLPNALSPQPHSGMALYELVNRQNNSPVSKKQPESELQSAKPASVDRTEIDKGKTEHPSASSAAHDESALPLEDPSPMISPLLRDAAVLSVDRRKPGQSIALLALFSFLCFSFSLSSYAIVRLMQVSRCSYIRATLLP